MKNFKSITPSYTYKLGFLIILILCIYRPPFSYENINAIFSIISATIILISFIFKENKRILYLSFLLVLSYFLYQLIFFGITASYSLLISSFAVLYLKNECDKEKKHMENMVLESDFIYLSIIFCILPSFFFIFESHTGRYSTINGDPNYTSLILISPLLIAYYSATSNIRRAIVCILIISVILFTVSRTAIIALLLFIISSKLKSLKLKKTILLVTFLFSIFSQYLVANWFPDLLSMLDFDSSNRLLNLNDKSNAIRIEAYNSALDTIIENKDYFIFNGARFYFEWNRLAINIPHNWFIQAIFGYGLLMTALFSLILLSGFMKLSKNISIAIPYFTFILFFASSLSVYPLQVPLSLLIFYFLYIFRGNSIE